MAKIRDDQPLVPSVLDRLLDDEPQNTHETPKSRNQVLRDLKQSVRRDLENLLNTRWRCIAWPIPCRAIHGSWRGPLAPLASAPCLRSHDPPNWPVSARRAGTRDPLA